MGAKEEMKREYDARIKKDPEINRAYLMRELENKYGEPQVREKQEKQEYRRPLQRDFLEKRATSGTNLRDKIEPERRERMEDRNHNEPSLIDKLFGNTKVGTFVHNTAKIGSGIGSGFKGAGKQVARTAAPAINTLTRLGENVNMNVGRDMSKNRGSGFGIGSGKDYGFRPINLTEFAFSNPFAPKKQKTQQSKKKKTNKSKGRNITIHLK